MKRIFAVIVSIALLISFTSCNIREIIDSYSGDKEKAEEKLEPVLVKWKGREFDFASHDDAIQRESYYRRSGLGSDLHDDLYDAVVNGVSILDVSEYGFDGQEVEYVFRNFISDNPALFYLSRNFKYIFSDDGIVSDILLMYTDGEVTDEFDDECKLIKTADRKIIADKIDKLEERVNEILDDIPESASIIDKEKMIHDYIVENTEYNDTHLSLYENSSTVPHIFDVYGALCEGEAVCEGYAKAFQLLCYEVGIQCVQVEGEGNSDEHMWNAVLIDYWYHVDVTWDDNAESDIPYYGYFNIPDEICFRDHKVVEDYILAPDCTAENCTFYNIYCTRITSLDKPPEYYKRVADAIDRGVFDYIIIYADGIEVTEAYMREYFLDIDSYFMRYVDKKGYDITPKWEYMCVGDYYYIPLE